MSIRDPFSYSGRWDSVGLDCIFCNHFVGPKKWPDVNRESHCSLHKILFMFDISKDGYKSSETFCKDYKADRDGRGNPKAKQEFDSIKDQLESGILYGACGVNGNLMEYKFSALERRG